MIFLYQDKDYASETEYIHNVLKKHLPNINHLLEFGSGSGKHAELLAKKGLRVNGIDLSSAMLEEALKRKKCHLMGT